MDREYYNLERRESDHKTTFQKFANANGYKKIDIEKDCFGQASEEDPDDDDVSGSDFTIKFTSNSILIKKLPRFHCATERFTKCIMWTVSDGRKLRKILEKRYKDYRRKYQNKDGQTVAILFFNEQGEMQSRGFRTDELEQLLNEISKDNK